MSSQPGCVVVGAGLAAAHAVETLRAEEYDRPITLVGTEPHRPYERPGLSKEYLQGKTDRDALFVHPERWYVDHEIATYFAATAVALDLEARRVRLSTGDELSYEHLVLATGARPRQIDLSGADLDGVRTLRTLQDSDALRARLVDGNRWVIIGGGWIGLEVAAAARLAGGQVTVLEQLPLPLAGVLGDELGAYVADLHRRNGVDVRTGTSVEAIEGSAGVVTGVRTSDGLVPADIVVVGIGAVPNTELASAAGLKVERGIVVDEGLRSADPVVLAAGDVAEAYNTASGRTLRVEHWDNAIRQGRLAALSVLGRPDRYDWQPYFYTDQFDFGMEYVGASRPSDRVTIRGELSDGAFIAFWSDGDRVTAAMNVNVWDVNEDLRHLVGRDIPTARLLDTTIELTEL